MKLTISKRSAIINLPGRLIIKVGGFLQIEYKTKKLEKVCTNAQEAEKQHGHDMALKIQQRVDEIHAALNVEMMIQFGIGRCHLLKGDRKNQYAVDLVHPYRLVFEKQGNDIQIANIMEIVDYHN